MKNTLILTSDGPDVEKELNKLASQYLQGNESRKMTVITVGDGQISAVSDSSPQVEGKWQVPNSDQEVVKIILKKVTDHLNLDNVTVILFSSKKIRELLSMRARLTWSNGLEIHALA